MSVEIIYFVHGTTTDNAQSVLDGNLDPFISAYLRWNSINKSEL